MPFRATPVERINDAITTAGQAVTARVALKDAVAHCKTELSLLNDRVRTLKKRLRDEERRCHRFERVTLPSLIHGVLGTREVRRKERQDEYLRIREALLSAMAERDQKVVEVEQLQDRSAPLENAEHLLAEALQTKARWLRDNDVEAGSRLWELAEGEQTLLVSLQKIEKALQNNQDRGTSRPTMMRQLAMLQDMQMRKRQRLQIIWQERQSLLLDGARLPMSETAAQGL
ncbi:MAG: hypothetical protein SGI86_17915 [Deltaproteobacteria bacterium]|nr:hypothetical protein [Deltaproteobacteria bacterium]